MSEGNSCRTKPHHQMRSTSNDLNKTTFEKLYWELFKNSENYLRIPRTVWEFRELFETSENCFKISRTILKFRELFETCLNCLRFPRTAWDFPELFKNYTNCLKFLRAIWGFRELSKNFLELFDTSDNYVRFWEHFTRNHGREQWLFRIIVRNTSRGCFWKIYLDCPELGGNTSLIKQMQLFDKGYFFCWFRMFPAVFEEF